MPNDIFISIEKSFYEKKSVWRISADGWEPKYPLNWFFHFSNFHHHFFQNFSIRLLEKPLTTFLEIFVSKVFKGGVNNCLMTGMMSGFHFFRDSCRFKISGESFQNKSNNFLGAWNWSRQKQSCDSALAVMTSLEKFCSRNLGLLDTWTYCGTVGLLDSGSAGLWDSSTIGLMDLILWENVCKA